MGVGEPNSDSLDREQTAGLQGVTLQGEGERENELPNQHPACNKRSGDVEHNGIEDQKRNNRLLIPVGGGPKEVLPVRVSYRSVHTTLSFYNVM